MRRPARRPRTAGAPAARRPNDDRALERWVAPTSTTPVDEIDVDRIDVEWLPQREGVPPLARDTAAVLAVGIQEPLLLRPSGNGRFVLVAGHRSLAAARAAGLARVPAVVRELGDLAALEAQLLEGRHAGRLTAAGAGEARRRLIEAGATPEQADALVGAARSRR